MVVADTNVVLRLVTGDDPAQTAIAERVAEQGIWVSHVVLAETAWTLRSTYGREHAEIARLLQMLLDTASVAIEHADVAAAALALYRDHASLGFSDCLILERARQLRLPLATFDKALSRLEGTARLGR